MMSSRSYGRFLLLWMGEWISSIGSGLTAFALGVYVFHMTGTATSVAMVTLCAYVPSIVLGPFGGVLADRFDRRLMMITGDLGSAVGLVFILVLMLEGEPSLGQICLGVALSSVFVSLLEPAYKATITDLLSVEQFAKASGLVQLAASSKYLLSPVLAGSLLAITDIKNILIIDIFTFLVTVFAVFAVKRSMNTPKSAAVTGVPLQLFKDLREGWKALASVQGVLQLIFVLSMVTFCAGFLQTLFTPLLLAFTDTRTLGMIESISAVGMLAGSLVIGIFSLKGNIVRLLAVSLGVAGLCFALVGMSTNTALITSAGFLFFAALPFVNTSADVMIRSNIPGEVQGRAWGIIGVLSQFGYVAAYACSGVLSDQVFNPLLQEGGMLASSVGRIIGTGEGRGIGLLLMVAGGLIVFAAFMISGMTSIRSLNKKMK
ncbi:MFS transporter [Paenibacillus riograndensis]